MTATTDDYLEWLYESVGLPRRGRAKTYWKLCRQLHAKEFIWIIHNDHSRAEDGKELRWEFAQQAGLERVPTRWLLDQPCSMLEMIIALARRIASLTDGDIRVWFVQLLHNVGLSSYTDLAFDGYISIVDEKIECLKWRTYLPNGSGGLFPLRHPRVDQRNVELWVQMNSWLLEMDTVN